MQTFYMTDAGKVMLLGLRKMQIEEDLEKAKIIVEAFKVAEKLQDEFNESLLHVLEETAKEYEAKVEELIKSLDEAEAEWLEASEEYKKERGAEA